MINRQNILLLGLPTAGALVAGLLLSTLPGIPDDDAWTAGCWTFFVLVIATALMVRYRQQHSDQPNQEDSATDSDESVSEDTLAERGSDSPAEQTEGEPQASKSTKIMLLVAGAVILTAYGLAQTVSQGPAIAVFVSTVLAGVLLTFAAILWRNGRWQSQVSGLKKEHAKRVSHWKSARMEVVENAWFEEQIEGLSTRHIRHKAPEVEVEVKFIYPLLRHLGYERDQLELRVPVPMQEGSQKTVRQADWVVQSKTSSESLVVVEAKAPRQPLDDAVAKQARSYALRLEAPVYVTTNGKKLKIYHRGVLRDQCVVSCRTSELSDNWETIEAALHKSAVETLKVELS